MATIKELRESAGMSRETFCNTFNIPIRTVISWERGDRKPPEYVFNMISMILREIYSNGEASAEI